MAVAEVDLYNLALSHIAVGVEVQSVDENSAAANACRRFFAQTRDEILSEFAWPFATAIAPLALVATDPNSEWGFAYQYPDACVFITRLIDPTVCARPMTQDARIPYLVRAGASGRLIYTDLDAAECEYVQAITDTTLFSPLFAQAVAFKLGFYIAPRVTAGDPFKLGPRAFQLYQQTMESARDRAADEQQDDQLPDAEFIRVRD